MDQFSQKDWIEYLNKIQDKERQKLSSSGLSNWTIFFAMGALIYWISSQSQLLFEHISLLLLFSTLFLNISTGVGDLFNSNFRLHKILKYREPTESVLDINISNLMKSFEVLIGCIMLSFNILSAIYYPELCIFFLLFVLRMFFGLFSILRKTRTVNSNTDIESIVKDARKSALFYLCYSVLPFLYLIIFKPLPTSEQLTIILSGFVLPVIFFMVQLILLVYMKRLRISWLESFEKEVIINNLSAEIIRKKYISDYLSISNIDDYL
jgi:hypothetical protein